MVGDDLLRDPQLPRDLPNSQRAVFNLRKDAAPCAVGQCMQRPFDGISLDCHAQIQARVCTNVNLWTL
jgi:hypothetical protein